MRYTKKMVEGALATVVAQMRRMGLTQAGTRVALEDLVRLDGDVVQPWRVMVVTEEGRSPHPLGGHGGDIGTTNREAVQYLNAVTATLRMVEDTYGHLLNRE